MDWFIDVSTMLTTTTYQIAFICLRSCSTNCIIQTISITVSELSILKIV